MEAGFSSFASFLPWSTSPTMIHHRKYPVDGEKCACPSCHSKRRREKKRTILRFEHNKSSTSSASSSETVGMSCTLDSATPFTSSEQTSNDANRKTKRLVLMRMLPSFFRKNIVEEEENARDLHEVGITDHREHESEFRRRNNLYESNCRNGKWDGKAFNSSCIKSKTFSRRRMSSLTERDTEDADDMDTNTNSISFTSTIMINLDDSHDADDYKEENSDDKMMLSVNRGGAAIATQVSNQPTLRDSIHSIRMKEEEGVVQFSVSKTTIETGDEIHSDNIISSHTSLCISSSEIPL